MLRSIPESLFELGKNETTPLVILPRAPACQSGESILCPEIVPLNG